MYKIFVILAIISVAHGAVTPISAKTLTDHEHEIIPILKSETDVQPDGSYAFSFEGGDGTTREEKGTIVNPGAEDSYVAVTGEYKYIDPEGQTITVHYTADENGFIPEGNNIPQSISKAARAGIVNP